MSDGGKIYVYVIDGVENSFPVPPKGFQPLTADDKQLEVYGFPPRPNKENQEEYDEWVELMSHYKGTPEPNIEISVEADEGISMLNTMEYDYNDPRDRFIAGYASTITDSKFYTMVQCDMVYPNVTTKKDFACCSFWTVKL